MKTHKKVDVMGYVFVTMLCFYIKTTRHES